MNTKPKVGIVERGVVRKKLLIITLIAVPLLLLSIVIILLTNTSPFALPITILSFFLISVGIYVFFFFKNYTRDCVIVDAEGIHFDKTGHIRKDEIQKIKISRTIDFSFQGVEYDYIQIHLKNGRVIRIMEYSNWKNKAYKDFEHFKKELNIHFTELIKS